ncbi:MAG: DNA-binding protein [Candidatus Korarchaeum sp.]|nr:DNA-binding protein [Candidatus Korarchaeum sp.]MDW8035225.1 DNA-binding protein [Candidatus Korarchaeum sp.]
MSEDETLRRIQERMLAEMSERKSREEEAARELQRIDAIVKSLLTTEAWQRLKRVELVKPELANEVKVYLIQLYSAGKLTRKLTDDELKVLLANLSERERRDFNIRVV